MMGGGDYRVWNDSHGVMGTGCSLANKALEAGVARLGAPLRI